MIFTETMPIGEKLVNSIAITILGMTVVFMVLIIIAYSLGLLKILFQEKKTNKDLEPERVTDTNTLQNTAPEAQGNIEDLDLLLLITAAIAAESGVSSNDFFVKSINQMPQKSSIWASTGRQENMSRLSK